MLVKIVSRMILCLDSWVEAPKVVLKHSCKQERSTVNRQLPTVHPNRNRLPKCVSSRCIRSLVA